MTTLPSPRPSAEQLAAESLPARLADQTGNLIRAFLRGPSSARRYREDLSAFYDTLHTHPEGLPRWTP